MIRMMYRGARPTAVRRGPRLYEIVPGTPFEAHPADVNTLERVGAHVLEEPAGELDDLTLTELRRQASDAQVPGRSSMTRAELIDALTTDPQEAER